MDTEQAFTYALHVEAILEYSRNTPIQDFDSPTKIAHDLATNTDLLNLLRGTPVYIDEKIVRNLLESTEFRKFSRTQFYWMYCKMYSKEFLYCAGIRYSYGVQITLSEIYDKRCGGSWSKFQSHAEEWTNFFYSIQKKQASELKLQLEMDQAKAVREQEKLAKIANRREMLKELSDEDLVELKEDVDSECDSRSAMCCKEKSTSMLVEEPISQSNPTHQTSTLSISAKFEQLIEEANVYTETVNRKADSVSHLSGHIILQLKDEGISFEKMPIVIGLVIKLLFGNIDKAVLERTIKSPTSFRRVTDRASVQENLFMKENHIQSSKGCCLGLDESNKLDQDIVLKVLTYESPERNNVGFYSLGSDPAKSKKASCSSDSNIEDLIRNLSPIGFAKITSGISDSAAAATGGLQLILQGRDNEVQSQPIQNNRQQLIFASDTIKDQCYDYSVPIAGFRRGSCMMHNFENTLRSFLDAVLQSQGLSHNCTVSQVLHSTSYYVTGKFYDVWQLLALESVDEDIDEFKHLPVSVRGKFKRVCRTRWLSGERQCFKLEELLEVKASPSLVDFIKDEQGLDDEEWQKMLKICCCIHSSDAPSHFLLGVYFIINHSPGSVTADNYTNLRLILDCLTNSIYRIEVVLCSELYGYHLQWASFANGISQLHSSFGNRYCRRIESAIFLRNFLGQAAELDWDWTSFFPKTYNFVLEEMDRTQNSNLEQVFNDIIMSEAKEKVLDQALIYFRNEFMTDGLCVLLITDPMVAKYVARALLLALHRVDCIPLKPEEISEFQSTYLPSLPLLNEDSYWTINSTTHAFPRMTFAQFQRCIEETNFPHATAKSKIVNLLVRAYGLCHPKVLEELKIFAKSDFDGTKLFRDERDQTPWRPGMYLKYYWSNWRTQFPAMADSLENNFATMLSTTTLIEQGFSTYNSKADSNASESSNSSRIMHHMNATMEIKRETADSALPSSDSSGRPIRSLRNKSQQSTFIAKVSDRAKTLPFPMNLKM